MPPEITIRRETPEDILAVHRVEADAFGREFEADAVDAVRENGQATFALVALVDGQIVGHVMFSPVEVERGEGNFQTLAPLAVAPAYQKQGIGSALARAGLDECRALGVDFVALMGSPAYYPRFGFEPGSRYGLRCPWEAHAEGFMVIGLTPGIFERIGGLVRWLPEWGDV